jgi:hypothetical protein
MGVGGGAYASPLPIQLAPARTVRGACRAVPCVSNVGVRGARYLHHGPCVVCSLPVRHSVPGPQAGPQAVSLHEAAGPGPPAAAPLSRKHENDAQQVDPVCFYFSTHHKNGSSWRQGCENGR